MNLSLTIFFTIAVLLAMAAAILALDDIEHGAILPWQFVASFVIGLCITHGKYAEIVYSWMIFRVRADGPAGSALSAIAGFSVEIGVASLPMLAGAALYSAMATWDKYCPLRSTEQTRRRKVAAIIRTILCPLS